MGGRSPEPVVLVKLASPIVEGVDKHGSYARVLGYLYTTLQRVLKQGCAQLEALCSNVDGQASKYHHRHRIRHILANRPCCILVSHGSRRQSVVTHYFPRIGRDDERATGATGLVAKSAALEPFIENCFAATEYTALVIQCQRLGRVQIHAPAQGALTDNKRSSPELGCTGASSMAVNCWNFFSSRLKNT